MLNKSLILSLSFLFLSLSLLHHVEAFNHHDVAHGHARPMVKRDERRSLVDTEYGRISAASISDGTRPPYYLQFITLEPNSLFLPALLHSDMVFYVHTGRGRLSWADEDETRTLNIRRGDVYRLQPGSVFYIESGLEQEREKLRIYAIFSNTQEESFEPLIGAYTSISDLILGFDKRVLQSAFKVPEYVIEELFNATKPLAMVRALPKKKKSLRAWEARLLKAFVGDRDGLEAAINGKKKTKTYNILDADPDFTNCNGWSLTVDRKDLRLLKDSNIGIFMVNLTKGSMMGPHWNPMATEIAIVLHGQGMIRVVCPSTAKESDCKNMRFRAEEGDVFAVPRFHPMAQMSFNNDSFVFAGFSTSTRANYPQFLAGKRSVLQKLDRQILSVSFNVSDTIINQILDQQEESVILDCTSCAEEEESIMQEEIRREREEEEAREREEERKREEEEARRREEERKREEEEARRREEEEAKRREEEEARRKEEEEEARRREEEEEARRREEERERERQEEERREQEERERQEEEERRRKEEEAEREQEEARKQEEERQRRQQEEEEREREERRRQEEEEEEEEEREREERQQEEEEEREREERQQQQEEQEEEEEREREERQEEEEERRQEAEEEQRRREEEAKREQEEEERRWEEEGGGEVRKLVKKSDGGKRILLTNVLKL